MAGLHSARAANLLFMKAPQLVNRATNQGVGSSNLSGRAKKINGLDVLRLGRFPLQPICSRATPAQSAAPEAPHDERVGALVLQPRVDLSNETLD